MKRDKVRRTWPEPVTGVLLGKLYSGLILAPPSSDPHVCTAWGGKRGLCWDQNRGLAQDMQMDTKHVKRCSTALGHQENAWL